MLVTIFFNMYDICHPSYYKIGRLGCKDPVKISTAFYIYIELCEVKKLWNVKYFYNQQMDLIYLEAHQNPDASAEIYIPWSMKNHIKLDYIDKIQKELSNKQLTFVFRSGDSTSVYYRVTAGLITPVSPQISKQLREREEKKAELECEIRRNISNLYELSKTLDSVQNLDESTSNDCVISGKT
ncbi:tRNA-splicing endonuclease subunit Sen15-like [Prorops nasuta]|uniref:tRNA-splicing endonuclease subunit Sen15-like n=1 Tax=Prorops nasuta TaxID=863751 RepID=UPI0034CED76F